MSKQRKGFKNLGFNVHQGTGGKLKETLSNKILMISNNFQLWPKFLFSYEIDLCVRQQIIFPSEHFLQPMTRMLISHRKTADAS